MWYSAIASALLGIGAAIITNDVGDSSSHRQRLSFEFDSKRTAFPGGQCESLKRSGTPRVHARCSYKADWCADVTCRLRPGMFHQGPSCAACRAGTISRLTCCDTGEAFLNFGSRCDDPDDESRSVYQECDEPSGTHGRAGVMSLSDDASTCTLYPLESTDLQQHLVRQPHALFHRRRVFAGFSADHEISRPRHFAIRLKWTLVPSQWGRWGRPWGFHLPTTTSRSPLSSSPRSRAS